MSRLQVIILTIMSILVVCIFVGAGVFGLSVINSSPDSEQAQQPQTAAQQPQALETSTATSTPIPTSTVTATSTETPIPTPTSTRVVGSTATATSTKTPRPTRTPTATKTNTPVPTSGGSSSGGTSGGSTPTPRPSGPTPTPRPTSRYELDMLISPIEYETTNHFLVILAQVKRGGVLLPGYKMVGSHQPSGATWESLPTCPNLCKASGPGAITDEDGKVIEKFNIREGNLFFDPPFYETGVWTVVIVDPRGRQASEIWQLKISSKSDDRRWFYVEFGR